jgi:L-cysteine desulfidase
MTVEINLNSVLDLLKNQVTPALGCTEPIAVALAAAKAREEIDRVPSLVSVYVSSNIYKNSLGVYIPGTEDRGIQMAAALGIVAGISDLRLQVLQKITTEDTAQAKKLVNEGRIKVYPAADQEGLYIKVEADGSCEVIIEGKHDHIVSVKVNGRSIFSLNQVIDHDQLEFINKFGRLKISQLREIVEAIEAEKLDFISDGIKMNMHIAEKGLEKKHGLGLGPALKALTQEGILSDDLVNKTRILTASAADARMSGARLPVMTSGGSGNQGIAAILPVVLAGDYRNVTGEKLVRAVALSHLINIYIKQYTGKLSAVCGCAISAGAGAAAGIVWMLNGSDEQISGAIKNIISNLFGMICDGAKASCSFKLSTASGEAVIAAMLALNGVIVSGKDGIIFHTAEDTIVHMGEICARGMKSADQAILDIMMKKSGLGRE